MLKKEIHFKTSCHTRLLKPNVFTIRTWLLDFLLQPVIINTLQNIVKIRLKESPPTPLRLLLSSLGLQRHALLFECDFSPMRRQNIWQITLRLLYYCTGWLLTASRQSVNHALENTANINKE